MSFRLHRTYIIVEWWRTTASVSFRLSRTYIIVVVEDHSKWRSGSPASGGGPQQV